MRHLLLLQHLLLLLRRRRQNGVQVATAVATAGVAGDFGAALGRRGSGLAQTGVVSVERRQNYR